MKKDVNFAVVIVTYNRKILLEECVEAILDQSFPVERIIIIDNASSDGTNKILERYKEDNRFFIKEEKKNQGGAYGFYEGIKIALGFSWEWLIIIDDDAILSHNFIKIIHEAIFKYPKNKAFSGRVLTKGFTAREHRARNSLKVLYKPFPVSLKEYEKESFEYELSSFCGLVINRGVIEKIGLPLKDLFIRNDDFEYSLRMRRLTKIRNINSALINHKTVITTMEKDFSWKLFYNMRNAIYISGKYYGIIAKIEICIRYLFGMLFNSIRYGVIGDKSITYVTRIYRDSILAGIKNEIGIDLRYYPQNTMTEER